MARRYVSSFLLILTAFLVGTPLVAAVRRPQHRLAMQQIQQLETEWRSAQLGGDIAAMDRLLSDDFLGITAAGTVVTKAQQIERMRTHQFVIKSLQVEDAKIKLVGAIAIVTSLANVEGVSEGEAVSGGYRYTRVYQRIAGFWRITSFEATRIGRGPSLRAARTSETGLSSH